MTSFEFLSGRTLLALGAALGYTIATIIMKYMADTTDTLLIGAVAAVLALTVIAEVHLLRQVDLGLAYVAIIATESILVLLFALMIGETLSPREMAGAALVVAGAVMVSF
ncbi:hypothetical protein [Tropicimonas sediminicola]|uniref:5-aminolevulinate synthase n=1 Tax=Tropicimonas sediminicola TaxID=1031541 RepID=A0A239KH04_9RHOB|nr:hypothetical protein [Tropicimonas sediminicola]SNT16424.1 hypothetical protein SAMN05421757_10752 [Tropicimonas sediminicola]